MEVFNNRELAVAFWAGLLFVWILTKAKLRKSLWGVAVALSNKAIRRLLALTIIYICGLVFFLKMIGLWEIQHAKLTAFWTISVAVVMVFRGGEDSGDPAYFRRSIKDILKITVFVEFVVSLYSFNIWIELVTIPLLVLVVLMQAFAESKEEYSSVRSPLQFILVVYGLVVLIFTIYRIGSDFDGFASMETLREMTLPPILSLAFLPFMYPLLVYLAYEQAFARISFSLRPDLLEFAKRRSLIRFRGDRILLKRWAKIISYQDINSRRQLKESIDRAKFMQLSEKRQSVVLFENGWSPANSRHYLAEKGVVAGDYEPSFDESWRATSDYYELKDMSPVLCNNIAYYLQGNARYVLCLKLVLNVNDIEDASRSHAIFLDFCDALALSSLKVELEANIREALSVGKSADSVQEKRFVAVERHDWVGSADGGYELIFTITHPSHEGMHYQPWLTGE